MMTTDTKRLSDKTKTDKTKTDKTKVKQSRQQIAKQIYQEVTKYLSSKGYSCHHEVGLNKWGKLRADVLAFNYKQEVIIVEVKSCWQDYKSDSKFLEYLDFCHKLYFAVSQDFPLKPEFLALLKQHKIGLLVVDLTSPKLKLFHSHSTSCEANAGRRLVQPEISSKIILRLAYRNGKLRTNKRTWMT